MQGERRWPPTLLSDGALSASSTRPVTIVTADALANTMGAWVEVIAATSADIGWVSIAPTTVTALTNTDTSMLLDLGVGAAASEVAVIPSLGVGWLTMSASSAILPVWTFPIFIPKGSRVALRNQSALVGGSAIQVRVTFFGMPNLAIPSSSVAAIGVNAAASRGTILATPAGANVEGAWTNIGSPTVEPYTAVGISIQGGGDTTQASATALVDIGIGSTAIVSDIGVTMGSAETIGTSPPLVFPANIPAGSQLTARWQGSAVTGGLDVILHGIRAAG